MQWLVSPAAEPWLAAAAEFAASPAPRDVQRLRRDLTPEQCHLVLETARLRRVALAKFPLAAQMFFTQQAYEQATDSFLANWKARRFPQGQSVVDLCCSIGGDALALAERGEVTGVDLNAGLLVLGQANAEIYGVAEQCKFTDADATSFPVENAGAWHADPDRRSAGRRTSQVEFGSPSLDELDELLTRNGNAAIKLAPGAVVPERWQSVAECEWISRQGECRQAVAWFGELAQKPGVRVATALTGTGELLGSISGSAAEELPLAGELGQWVFEPDPAVLAARLTGAAAHQHGLVALASDIPYLTGNEPITDGLLDAFEVVEVLPLHPKAIASWLRQQGAGHVEVKRRGVDVDPLPLQRQWSGSGDLPFVVFLTRLGDRRLAIAAHRCTRAGTDQGRG